MRAAEIHTNLKGRHQLSGKPQLSDNFTGTKRRAETVLFHSLLRVDPSNIDGTHSPSDGLGNGVGSCSNASPESYNTSSVSTPPSTEGPSNGQYALRSLRREHVLLHQGAQDVQRKKLMLSPTLEKRKWSLSQLQRDKRRRAHQTTTFCTNCQTTLPDKATSYCEIMRTYLH